MIRVRSLLLNLALASVVVLVMFAVIEFGLRLTGFSYVLYPQDIEFGMPDPVVMEAGFLEDQDLFWVTKDYPQKLERLARKRPPLLFMGDSCTHLGRYDEALVERLALRGETLYSGNLGVAGWSSYQGRQQLERDVVPLAPAVVTIYYGWNDHWIGFGVEDTEVARIKSGISGRFDHLRTAQLLNKSRLAFGSMETAFPNRVPLGAFRDNLRAMIETSQKNGIRPMLLTAPSSHEMGNEPEHLGTRWLREVDDLVPMHQSYVEAVRDVAAVEQVPLCDLEARFNALGQAKEEELFMEDGIHLNPEGDTQIAAFLDECLQEYDLWSLILQRGKDAS